MQTDFPAVLPVLGISRALKNRRKKLPVQRAQKGIHYRVKIGIFRRYLLKGPKHEIFFAGIFTQIYFAWIGEEGIRPKNPKSVFRGLTLPFIIRDFCFSPVGHIA